MDERPSPPPPATPSSAAADESPRAEPEAPLPSRAAAPRAVPHPASAAAAAPSPAANVLGVMAASPAGSPVSQLDAAMPYALQEQLTNLETWARANRRDSRWDAIKFWALKIPAIVVSAGSGVSAYFKPSVAVIGGAVASMCVLIDALNPRGALKNAHLRAFNDLRMLQERMKSEWQIGVLRHEDSQSLAAEIIEWAAKEKERINDAITIAETSLAVATRRGKR